MKRLTKSVTQELTNAAASVLALAASPVANYIDVLSMSFVAEAGTAQTVDVHKVPAGGSASIENLIMGKDTPLAANGTLDYSGPPVTLEPGEAIFALADANDKVVMHVKYDVVNPVGSGGV